MTRPLCATARTELKNCTAQRQKRPVPKQLLLGDRPFEDEPLSDLRLPRVAEKRERPFAKIEPTEGK
jgi:hypothetical protein